LDKGLTEALQVVTIGKKGTADSWFQQEGAMKFVKEFRDFINRGNVIDLAVGIVIGAAFTAIVNSLVNDLIMPIIGIIMGGIDFSGLTIQIGDAAIAYGNFLQAIINFLIIAFAVFMLVKGVNQLYRKQTPAPKAPPEEVKLLTEIRDTLKAQLAAETGISAPVSTVAAPAD
jgi:large conductance mechanosensitive channel